MFNHGRTRLPIYRAVNRLAVVSAFALSAEFASAQIELSAEAATTPEPYASFQYATLTGTTNTVGISLLPVVSASGKMTLENVTLVFGFDSSGNLVISSLNAAPAPTPIICGFKAGKYVGPSTIASNMFITVAGPGLTTGGATEWTLATPAGAWYDTFPTTATWYDGPLTSNPLYPRISAAKITSTAWTYGVSGGSSNYYGLWEGNSLLGFSQVGNTLTIVTFTDNNGKDYSEPVSQVTYTLSL